MSSGFGAADCGGLVVVGQHDIKLQHRAVIIVVQLHRDLFEVDIDVFLDSKLLRHIV